MCSRWIILVAFITLKGGDRVLCQRVNFSNVQAFLNQFCLPGSSNLGCTNSSVVPQGDPTPSQPLSPTVAPFPSSTASPPAPSSPSGCFANEKRCPQLRSRCVPAEIDCNVVNSGVTCRIPEDFGVKTQVLICGDDTPLGVRCGIGTTVPVLTVLLVQCQGSSQDSLKPVTSLDVLLGPGGDGGAGIYQCSPTGAWEPRLGSAFLNSLRVSCRNAGCGRLPQPSQDMPIFRRWSWVRGIYKKGQIHCTGTLVSRNCLITAAHCVTRSPVGNEPDDQLEDYMIELPGPDFNNPSIKTRPERIHIHPRYRYNNGVHEHDLAIITFDFHQPYELPAVCITDRPYAPGQGKEHVVFNLDPNPLFSGLQNPGPHWKYLEASWDKSCITTRASSSSGCSNNLPVRSSQFCASHLGSSLSKGSSGGPYLAEVGNQVEEVWVLVGVLSLTSQTTDGASCVQEHSVYGQVSDDSRWIKDCVFDRRCAF